MTSLIVLFEQVRACRQRAETIGNRLDMLETRLENNPQPVLADTMEKEPHSSGLLQDIIIEIERMHRSHEYSMARIDVLYNLIDPEMGASNETTQVDSYSSAVRETRRDRDRVAIEDTAERFFPKKPRRASPKTIAERRRGKRD